MSDQITHFRRFHYYDYSRGAALFLTFHLEPRICIFGDITTLGQMVLSPAGSFLDETIQREAERNPDSISLKKYQIMPEHLHMRIYLYPKQREPLKQVGHFVQNIKRWSTWKISKLGMNINWQENYHDRICLSREIIDRVDEYIDQNPLKWSLMHGNDHAMKTIEPLESPLLSLDEWWAGVGNQQLLSGQYRLLAIRLSRKLPESAANPIFTQLLALCRNGFIPISTFLSPLEQKFLQVIEHEDIPVIRAIPEKLKHIYRPTVNETMLFAAKRLLLISLCTTYEKAREYDWNLINERIAQIALASGGQNVYFTRECTL